MSVTLDGMPINPDVVNVIAEFIADEVNGATTGSAQLPTSQFEGQATDLVGTLAAHGLVVAPIKELDDVHTRLAALATASHQLVQQVDSGNVTLDTYHKLKTALSSVYC